MRRRKPARLLRVLLPVLALLMAGRSGWAQSLPLDEVMGRLAQAPQRRASFVEEKTFAALSGTLRSAGRLAYRKPDHLEKITTEPQAESLVVDGNRLIITAGNDAPRVVELDGQPQIRTLVDTIRGALSGNLALLRQSYDVSGTGTASDWRITLLPHDPAVAALVKAVHLAGDADLRSIESVAPNGDTDKLTITPGGSAG